MREFLPWHVIEEKIAAKASGSARIDEQDEQDEQDVEDDDDDFDEVPSSGVRAGVNAGAPLTYAVYTLADLEARSSGEVSMRMSQASFAALPPRPSRWRGVAIAGREVLRSALAWARSPSPRPRPVDVLRAPASVFVRELRVALENVDWKKVGVAFAIGAGILMVLLFGVLTAAELTDDLKPARASAATMSTSVNGGGAAALAVVEANNSTPPAEVAPEVAPEPAPAQIEIVEPAEVAPKPAPRGKGKGAKIAAGPPSEIFIP